MKQVIFHNYETFMDAYEKLEAWAKAGCGGLCFVARPFEKEPYVLSADAVIEQTTSEEEADNIFRNEREEIRERMAKGQATGIDFANFVTCTVMLEGEREGVVTRIATRELCDDGKSIIYFEGA